MRLFFAVPLPGEVQAALGTLRPRDANRDYRWSDPSSMHVTLAFLGQQPDTQLDALREIGHAAATATSAGLLKLGKPGSFGSRTAPRILWIGLEGGHELLAALHTRLTAGLQKANFAVADHDFTAHITLARRRESARGGPPPGWPALPPLPSAKTVFPLEQLTLFESRLSPRGATYAHVFDFPVGLAERLTEAEASRIVPRTVKDADQDE